MVKTGIGFRGGAARQRCKVNPIAEPWKVCGNRAAIERTNWTVKRWQEVVSTSARKREEKVEGVRRWKKRVGAKWRFDCLYIASRIIGISAWIFYRFKKAFFLKYDFLSFVIKEKRRFWQSFSFLLWNTFVCVFVVFPWIIWNQNTQQKKRGRHDADSRFKWDRNSRFFESSVYFFKKKKKGLTKQHVPGSSCYAFFSWIQKLLIFFFTATLRFFLEFYLFVDACFLFCFSSSLYGPPFF